MYNELLGFDIRLRAEDYVEARWNQGNRALYLLQPETKWPLSVDQMVWPSFFRYSKDRGLGHFESELTIDAVPINSRHEALELWPNLEEMRKSFRDNPINFQRPGIEIAVMLHSDAPPKFREYWQAVLAPSLSPNEPPKDWKFHGYDIADEYMLSGLANCGYTKGENLSLTGKWSDRLNEFGLLKTLEDASEFRKMTDQRVAEHSPFFIYSLFVASAP